MGKRGAVRISNSGFPVDHSGPGLRVGPTTSATADRKSEACPDGLSLSLKVVQCGFCEPRVPTVLGKSEGGPRLYERNRHDALCAVLRACSGLLRVRRL